jgi:5-formyltetrahydrofolate cyclo-ligase
MGGEVDTSNILRYAFDAGKKIFVPKVTGKRSEDMFMLQVTGQ